MVKPKFKVKKQSAEQAGRGGEDSSDPADKTLPGPSPDPETNLLMADLALRSSARLMRYGIERGYLAQNVNIDKAKRTLRGRSLGKSLLLGVIARIATRSVPGAVLVSGGLVAKTLYDRRKGRQAQLEGEKKLEEMAEAGKEDEQG